MRADLLQDKRIAIVFFGLVKNMSDGQAESYNDHVVQPLRDVGAIVHGYLHTHKVETFTNARNGEKCEAIDQDATITRIRRILPLETMKTDPSDTDTAYGPLERYTKNGCQWHARFLPTTPLYYIRQLHSVMLSFSLIKCDECVPDAVIFLRPDVMFHTSICVNDVADACNASGCFLTPAWNKFGGLNDRFAITSWQVAHIYANRLVDLEQHVEQGFKLHAERYLRRIVERYARTVHEPPLAQRDCSHVTFSRVRGNGKPKKERFDDAPETKVEFMCRCGIRV